MTLRMTSPSFDHEGEIPAKHTCEGADVSPSLTWTGIPPDAKSLALVIDDPDAPDPRAPKTTWVHWVVYDLPPTITGLPEDLRLETVWSGSSSRGSWSVPKYLMRNARTSPMCVPSA